MNKFTAPEASVLIVDDNEINLEVTAGFLEPLQMKVDMADSGRRALQLAQQKRYDLIFMDHMMPVMGGVETTERLRRMGDEHYRTVPIIALTGSPLDDIRDEFRNAGISGYLAKPIKPADIYSCVLEWIPRELIVFPDRETAEGKPAGSEKAADGKPGQCSESLPELPGINTADGIKYTGSQKMWLKLLGDFYKLIDSKANKIEKCLADGLIRDYTIEVHAMKNTARMIGAAHLSEWFFRMEKCGKAGDVETIAGETPDLIKELKSFKDILRPYGEENNRNKREVSASELIGRLTAMRDAMDRFDLDTVDAQMHWLEQCRIPEKCGGLMERLRVAVADVAIDEIMEIADRMIEILRE